MGWAFLLGVSGERTTPQRLNRLESDPNRYLAELIGRKIGYKHKRSSIEIDEIAGHEFPAWIKFGKGFPFIELYVAQVLHNAGIVYKERWGENVPKSVMERCRRALVAELENPTSELGRFIERIPILARKIHHEQIEYTRLLSRYGIAGHCRGAFRF